MCQGYAACKYVAGKRSRLYTVCAKVGRVGLYIVPHMICSSSFIEHATLRAGWMDNRCCERKLLFISDASTLGYICAVWKTKPGAFSKQQGLDGMPASSLTTTYEAPHIFSLHTLQWA